MMQAMLRGNWTIKVWCHKLSLLLMIDLKPSFRCVQRQTPDIWVMFLDTSRNHIVRVVLGSCRRWTSSCDEFHKAVLSRNSRLSPCFAIMTCVKRKDRKRCVYRHWQTKHVYSHIYIIYWINIYMCIYIYIYIHTHAMYVNLYIYLYRLSIYIYTHTWLTLVHSKTIWFVMICRLEGWSSLLLVSPEQNA